MFGRLDAHKFLEAGREGAFARQPSEEVEVVAR